MVIKVKCCECGDLLHLYVNEENRKKATNTKKFLLEKACCGMINLQCKE